MKKLIYTFSLLVLLTFFLIGCSSSKADLKVQQYRDYHDTKYPIALKIERIYGNWLGGIRKWSQDEILTNTNKTEKELTVAIEELKAIEVPTEIRPVHEIFISGYNTKLEYVKLVEKAFRENDEALLDKGKGILNKSQKLLNEDSLKLWQEIADKNGVLINMKEGKLNIVAKDDKDTKVTTYLSYLGWAALIGALSIKTREVKVGMFSLSFFLFSLSSYLD